MSSIILATGDGSRLSARPSAYAVSTIAAKFLFFRGVILMLAANSLWALAYVAPLALPEASAVEIALGRFIVYGLLSAALLNLGRVIRLSPSVLALGLFFALAGNIIYYILLVIGIQLAGAAMAVLIIGMLPVTIALVGQVQTDPSTLRRLALPFALFSGGLMLFNAARTNFFGDFSEVSWIGLLCVLASLIMWTWYALANGRFLGKTKAVSATEWSSIVGLASLVVALIALPFSWWLGLARDPTSLTNAELSRTALWSILLGGGSIWLGTVLFNKASKLLSISIVVQLIIFEAVFGMFYLFAASGDLPSLLELVGIAIAIFAVWMSIRRLQTDKIR